MEEKEQDKDYSNNTQARRYMLTINNEERTDEELIEYIKSLEHFKYSMFQREIGEETKTEHIQAFIVFSVGKRFSTIKKYFPRAHIEPAKGTNVQCRDYCSKSDTRVSGPFELGEFAEQRQRTDISGFMEMISAGASNVELRTAYEFLYFKNLHRLPLLREDLYFSKFDKEYRFLEVVYLFGAPGVGKSRSVIEKHGIENVYRITKYNNSAFDSYQGQDVIVFEEFLSSFLLTDMLNYLDIYPLMLPSRYTNRRACYTKVYILSNFSIYAQYPDIQATKPEQFEALLRRIHKIIKLTDKGEEIIYDKDTHKYSPLQLNIEEEQELPF